MSIKDRKTYWLDKEISDVCRFIRDCCKVGSSCQVKSKDLYDSYVAWCAIEGNEYCLVAKNKFITLLDKEFRKRMHEIRSFRTSTYRGWKGVALK